MPFPCYRHQISFVSGQLFPTVLAAGLPGAEPACVHGIVTPGMKAYGRILREALESRGRRYQEHELRDSGQQGIFDLLDAVRESCAGESLGLNLTGGTKLMALAAAEWAWACEVPTFYVDTGADTIVLPGRQWEYLPLPDVLDVRGLLAAGGYKVKSLEQTAVPGERRNQLRELLELLCTAPDAAPALQSLNACARMAAHQADRMAEDRATPTGTWSRLLDICQRAGMLHYANGWLCFPSEEARTWCNGLWFEEYVRMILYKMQCEGRIRDWGASVQVEKAGVPNELDALFCVRNRLFIVECKTAGMHTDRKTDEDRNKVSSMLYKADSLQDRLGGVFAQSMICSVLPLESREQKRARDIGIRVASGRELLQLDEVFTRWASRS
ncbi:Card1-like endonuclease domain-containing protein [Desulfovibrio sp. SGI.133]|uniref:Card1-like endonuclease domain-containing protein n=1 Tax=Desulfovibrio sp. SGI.133 TaxID=3420560 RepID=UPI003D0561D9